MLWHKTIGKGPNLVLLHGWGFSSDIFQKLIEKYKKSYCITVIDLPGHGRSDDVDGGLESWCEELIQFILSSKQQRHIQKCSKESSLAKS